MKALTTLTATIISSGALLLAAPAASIAATANATATRLEAVAFTSPRQGYGLISVNTGIARTCQVDIARTADGGSRFTRPVRADRWSCAAGTPVSFIAADSSGDVFAYGPGLRISHDHGRSWTSPRFNRQVLALSASGRSAWAVTANCVGIGPYSRGQDKCQLLLEVSGNGGRSWKLASEQPAGAVLGGNGMHPDGEATLTRTSAKDAYLLATPVLSTRGQPALWITRNGGSSWTMRQVPCHLSMTAALAIAPQGKLFVACAGQPGAGTQAKSVVASANGGRTWSSRATCVSCSPLGDGYLGQIAAVGDRTVFLVGDRTPLLFSHDGGGSWRARRPAIGDAAGGTYQIAFFGSHGIILGSDPASGELPAIWHSSDSGANWQVIHPVIP